MTPAPSARKRANALRWVLSPLILLCGGLISWTAVDLGPSPGPSRDRDRELGPDDPAYAALGDPSRLRGAFSRWQAAHESRGGDRNVTLAVRWTKGLSSEHTRATAVATLNLIDGRVQVAFEGLDEIGPADFWLVDNQPGPGRSVQPEAGDRFLHVGSVWPDARGRARLDVTVRRELEGFEVDLAAVTRRGVSPADSGLLFGALPLFQRLYSSERPVSASSASRVADLFARPVHAAAVPTLDAQIALGARLFFDETFEGNGRTCGTCHRAENNLTIDSAFIATLPPNDPLFVAEFDANLREDFEKPTLMRALGLILENVDGTDDLPNKFTMRGVPHTLGLGFSLTPAPNDATPPNQRTGWSGDGAPGNGTLREFAIGAVTQHATRTLARRAGIDFRLPTDEELDAMEAFQLFLGRDEELDLASLRLRSPLARRGIEVFLAADSQGGTVAAGKCNTCHANAGANSPTAPVNRNFDTGVESFPDPADDVDPANSRPDGGFGSAPSPTVPGAFGNGTFNTPSIVEAADTGPFFHNNSVETIEEAVAFYSGPDFNSSPSGLFLASRDSGGIGIQLGDADDEAVGALLRIINSLENVRATEELLSFIRQKQGARQNGELFDLALAEVADARQVLLAPSGKLDATAWHDLATAEQAIVQARHQPPGGMQRAYLDIALFWLRRARTDMQAS